MRLLILGINHQIQWMRIWSAGSSASGELERFEKEQKDLFRELLRSKIVERGVVFVGEETKQDEPSIAENLCASDRYDYGNVEIPLTERVKRNIPVNYENDPAISDAQKAQFNLAREDYIFTKTIEEAKGAESILLICGRSHVPALADRFRKAGYIVDEADVWDEPWYIEDWMAHMMRI